MGSAKSKMPSEDVEGVDEEPQSCGSEEEESFPDTLEESSAHQECDPSPADWPLQRGVGEDGSHRGFPVNFPVDEASMQIGAHVIQHGGSYVMQGLNNVVNVQTSKVQPYFDVSSTSVVHKCYLLFLPFVVRKWRIQRRNGQFLTQRNEVHSPELYIPVNAFFTFVLLAAFAEGSRGNFYPEFLSTQAMSLFTWLVVEYLAVVIVLYVCSLRREFGFTDIWCLLCYKLVGMSISLVVNRIEHLMYMVTTVWSGLAMAYYMFNILYEHTRPADSAETSGGKAWRWNVIACVAILQPCLMWYHITKAAI